MAGESERVKKTWVIVICLGLVTIIVVGTIIYAQAAADCRYASKYKHAYDYACYMPDFNSCHCDSTNITDGSDTVTLPENV